MNKALRNFDWSSLRHLGALGVIGFFWMPKLKLLFLFYLFGFLNLLKGPDEEEEKALEENGKSLKHYYLTAFYSQFNPRTLWLSTLQTFGELIIGLKHLKGLPTAASYSNKVEYSLPFEGSWIAINGGSNKENSHSWTILTQRYAYDFVITDERGQSAIEPGNKLEDYFCYEKEILSPADGVVVKVQDRIRDYTKVGDYSIDWKTKDFRGNFVVIRHHEKEFSFLAHLKRGSISVKAGDRVERGQRIGLCGNSGHSTEPHLHFHLQDSANFWIAAGLPIRFQNFISRSGAIEMHKQHAFVEKNEIVRNVSQT